MSSDEVVHRTYDDPDLVERVRARFGDGVIDGAGRVDRASLGRVVFGDERARRDLEGMIHPRIESARRDWIAAQRALDPPPPLLVCEVPLLFEVGLQDRFDAVLMVTASESVRRARVADRGQDFDGRAAGQMDEAVKRTLADRVFVNDGARDALDRWVAERFTEYARS